MEPSPTGVICRLCGHSISSNVFYRCSECCESPVICSQCVVASHEGNPLRIVEEWTDEQGFWVRKTLKALGLIIHLGHGGEVCCSVGEPRELCMVTLHGLQSALVRFCGCDMGGKSAETEYAQLLHVGFWPGSWSIVRTAFSLEVLEYFEQLSTQGNITAQDFMKTLVRLTDDVLPHTVKVVSVIMIFHMLLIDVLGSL